MPADDVPTDTPEPEWSRYWDKIARAPFLTDEEKREMLLKMGAPFPKRDDDPDKEKPAP